MKRFVVASAVALVIAFASASSAQAQIVYGYTAPANGGIVTNQMSVGPFGYQGYSKYYSPFTGVVQGQSYGTNIFGQSYGRSYGYNSFSGMGYRSGFYQPNYYAFPNGGYSYNYFGRRW